MQFCYLSAKRATPLIMRLLKKRVKKSNHIICECCKKKRISISAWIVGLDTLLEKEQLNFMRVFVLAIGKQTS